MQVGRLTQHNGKQRAACIHIGIKHELEKTWNRKLKTKQSFQGVVPIAPRRQFPECSFLVSFFVIAFRARKPRGSNCKRTIKLKIIPLGCIRAVHKRQRLDRALAVARLLFLPCMGNSFRGAPPRTRPLSARSESSDSWGERDPPRYSQVRFAPGGRVICGAAFLSSPTPRRAANGTPLYLVPPTPAHCHRHGSLE